MPADYNLTRAGICRYNMADKSVKGFVMADKNKEFVKEIADIEQDFPQWYTDVVLKTGLVDYGPVKGTMVIRPYGYAIWETIQDELNKRFKATGHENAYFPMLIPYGYLLKEAEHVEGFAPEVAVVTEAGGEKLSERLVIRPTSETIICQMYARWVQSYRDLPVMINQWANVVRWEKTTRPFLRTSEFLWQEGHTLHATEQEAQQETIGMLELYAEFAKNVLAMPVLIGKKSEKEKFAGAQATYSMEAMMQDGKSLQAGTTHFFGTNFSAAFDINYLDRDGVLKHPYQTSWGVSTRLIGALIMTHGDRRGLCLPPYVAPFQVVVIPIAAHKANVLEQCRLLKERLERSGVRVKLDDSDNSPGWKFNEYEMKGVPLRLEMGPRDIENGVITVSRRDRAGEKFTVTAGEIETKVKELLADIHKSMYDKAAAFMRSRIVEVDDMASLKTAVDGGNFAFGTWCGNRACEETIKAQTGASTRNIPFEQPQEKGHCVCCGKKGAVKIYFGKAY